MTGYTGSGAGPFNSSIGLVDTTDIVQGGLGGVSNVATKKLADNDAYLYKIMGGFENIVQLTNAGPVTSVNISVANLLRNVVVLYQSVNGYLEGVLPACNTVRVGDIGAVKRLAAGYKNNVKLTAYAGDGIIDMHGAIRSHIYLHGGESVVLYNVGGSPGYWQILEHHGNLYNVGDQMLGYTQKAGTVLRNGTVYNRVDYPRLWDLVNTAGAPLLVSDATWLSDPGSTGFYKYKSCFSTGDGSTTFRVPDDRGLFDRAMTFGSGRDPDRYGTGVGSDVANLQADELKSHSHTYLEPASGLGSGPYVHGGGNDASQDSGLTGGMETRPVNVAKYPLLVY